MNDPLMELLALQQQREVARRARAYRPFDDHANDPTATETRVRRPRRARNLGILLTGLVTRS